MTPARYSFITTLYACGVARADADTCGYEVSGRVFLLLCVREQIAMDRKLCLPPRRTVTTMH